MKLPNMFKAQFFIQDIILNEQISLRLDFKVSFAMDIAEVSLLC